MLLTTVIACAVLLSACNSKPNQDFVYENEKYGFSLNLPGDFAQKVDIKEEGNLIYFVDKEVQAKHPEQVFGVVGRIETYDKKEFSRDNLKELEDMYGLRYLGESGSYHFGWAHATDVQVPPDASEKTIQGFRALEKDFDAVIGSFTIKKADGGEEASAAGQQKPQNETDEYSLMAGNRPISLKSWYKEADLTVLLGKLVSENNEVLGSTADTYSGSHIKTLKYVGIVIQLFSPKDNGKEFWLMSVDLTSSKLQTPGGITVGSTLAQLKEAYKGIKIFPDGRTDDNNCAYEFSVREEYKYMIFEVEKGIVKEIKLYAELP
ncbi:hypothetical protein ACOBQJ_09930 [Pelotomaculum propionicicum]|uniref:hypothetical protein n=1 Tax=Pelotomaculum propionicicum TaxID=258475 RepID=UPI003B77336C